MVQEQSASPRTDFEWVYTEEPHATRRRLILEKYPEIKKLMGPDWRFKYAVTAVVLFQFLSLYIVAQVDPSWPVVIFFAYALGGTFNHSLMLAIHETAHNLPFGNGNVLANKLFGLFENLPLGLPMAVSFKKYHLDHHRYQGDAVLDVDIPCRYETILFRNSFSKLIWLFLQPAFYALRPFFVNPKPMGLFEAFNFALQLSFDAYLFVVNPKCLFYSLGGSLLSMGVHPLAGHFVAEHYLLDDDQEETHSYYGPLNLLTWNVGYHVEHHDFPYITSWRLPEVRRIAPEFYEHLPSYTSWVMVLYRFVTDPRVGPFARVKRPTILGSDKGRVMAKLNSRGASLMMRTSDFVKRNAYIDDDDKEVCDSNGNKASLQNGHCKLEESNGDPPVTRTNGTRRSDGAHAKMA